VSSASPLPPLRGSGLRSEAPLSTYRLQLSKQFDFQAATGVVSYLSALGVTHCYVSPISRAVPGSTHGYDVCRHGEISLELGGEAGFEGFVAELRRHDMNLILDFVPNHMSNDPATNDWWRDVLENGPSSPYARFFDIDWEPVKAELKDRLLLPILGEPYGEALERGALSLRFEAGVLTLAYGDYTLPINPRRSPLVLEHDLPLLVERLGPDSPELREFLSILTALRNLPAYTVRDASKIAERQREKEVARDRLTRLADSCPPVRDHIEAALAVFNGTPGDARSFDRLHDLLELQAYRLASWRTAADEINYRRFFDINALSGLRVEDAEVFDSIHTLLLRLIGEGKAAGVRLDHIDGLYDPSGYLAALAAAMARAQGQRRPYLVVEKIVSQGEELRPDWPVDGTTGYTFLNQVNAVFVDNGQLRVLERLYEGIVGRQNSFDDVAYESKRLIVSTALSSEFQVLAQALNRYSESDRRFRDFTLASIRRALRELVACFPVYRTYVRGTAPDQADAAILDQAIRRARRRNPAMESSVFDFLRFVLLPGPSDPEDGPGPASRLAIAMRFQQYTAPVHAKGIEDTAFYRYHVLDSLNEVGGWPGRGTTIAAFHEASRLRSPGEMLATTTHDTKRSEDARARLNVLSEVPRDWQAAVTRWRRINGSIRADVDGQPAPDGNDEYLFYQTVLAAWPNEHASWPVPDRAPEEFIERIVGYMHKAIKEAKLHTSWITPNVPYEAAVSDFVRHALAGPAAARFLASFVPFVRSISRAGATNSLAQLTLKLASPGVPDFYQGTELWDLSLVDPDNRRPVDWALRRRLLDSLGPLARPDPARGQPAPPHGSVRDAWGELLGEWSDGRAKLAITALGLRWRRTHPEFLLESDYLPLAVEGRHADRVIAFVRAAGAHRLIAVVPRLTAGLASADAWPLGEQAWAGTGVRLPSELDGRVWQDVFTGGCHTAERGTPRSSLSVGRLFDVLPVTMLWSASAV
jgi:(1->4)-alpha-D-glucan 1-alpha-D-glucosylmutase